MSASEESIFSEDPIGEVPRRGKTRYVVLALIVIVAVVLGLRRTRTKPVANDAAPPENAS